ncbi:hypothetical protein SJ05684_c08460 [Sinorhizobium sojae CCBAU 05684]|uniref:Uncharacterized protein n=1 Tax=Sinorhizobium sojae CCBAU 05684 TaxID=716928 RepID=A0A249PAJ0_9HYPH|nr:hypothetical protein SJ05684_c08460 [Sinorhizobium sojae CCBAU 05684]
MSHMPLLAHRTRRGKDSEEIALWRTSPSPCLTLVPEALRLTFRKA